MNKKSIALLGGLAMTLAAVRALAGPAITAIDASKVDGDLQTVLITFDGPAVKPNSFAMSNPPRIALDFAGAEVKLAKPSINVDSPLLKSAIAVEAPGRSRLILNLGRLASYRSQLKDNKLLLTLDGSMSPSQGATPVELAATAGAAQQAVAQIASAANPAALDFRRGKNGEGRIELTLPSPNTPVDVRRDGKNLAVDIIGATLPRQQVRRLDVTDFGTPVAKVDASNLGNNIRIQIQPQGDWDYSSYQTDGKMVVEVRRPAADLAAADNSKPVYKGDKLSLNFQNIEVRTVLQVIAEFTGLNIVTSDSVSGNITLRLKDVPWDQALDLILQTKGLDQRRNGTIIQIAPRDELLARDKQMQEARQQMATLEPLRSETFVLRYRSADDFKKVLDGDNTSGKKESILSDRGSVLIDPKTNTLIANDIGSVIDKIRDIIAKTDIPVKQVLIEARIVEATDNWERDLGIKLTYDRVDSKGIISGNPLGVNVNNVTNLNTNQPYVIQTTPAGVNLPITNPSGTLSALYNVGHSVILGLELQAMQAEDKGRIISSPRVMTSDREEATIEQGQEIPYQEASSSGATSVSFKKAVLSLKVKPQITPDNRVIMDITVNKDSANFQQTVNGTPSLSTEKIITQVLVDNGGTVVLGGIYQQQLNDVVNKVPLLGDIPVLGALFRSTQKVDKRSELLIFITPKVINDLIATGN
ncbi:type IV pilus secretin PilQ [Chromobacterium alticapitis]|uniref:Type IV pilus biogenesis and competence protein PilQ n=1 Tax=Chromobacterium alticapitis TaxID=2073169 RepID=A0A2S5DCJ6_9NEIS|nr:type IV pilus secretin PilQ [Chromobacterium alticapitis]POZ60741.1 type IV pilus secretin PilQ [Chromobacterium alticapitis]